MVNMSHSSKDSKPGQKLMFGSPSTIDVHMEDILISESQAQWMEEADSSSLRLLTSPMLEDTGQSLLGGSNTTIDYNYYRFYDWSNIQKVQSFSKRDKSYELPTSHSQTSNSAVSTTTRHISSTAETKSENIQKEKRHVCLQSPSLYSDSESLNSTLEKDIPDYVMDCPGKPIRILKETDREIAECLSISSSSSSSISPKFLTPASTMYNTAFSWNEASISPHMKASVSTSSPHWDFQIQEGSSGLKCKLKLNRSNKNVSGYGETSLCPPECSVILNRLDSDFHLSKEGRNSKSTEYDNVVGFSSCSTAKELEFLPTQCSPLTAEAQEKFDIIDKCLLSSLLPVANRLNEKSRVLRSVKASNLFVRYKDVPSRCEEEALSFTDVSSRCKEALSSTNDLSTGAMSYLHSTKGKSIVKSTVDSAQRKKSPKKRSSPNVNFKKHKVRIKMIPRKLWSEGILEIKHGDITLDEFHVPKQLINLSRKFVSAKKSNSSQRREGSRNKLRTVTEQKGDSPLNRNKFKHKNTFADSNSRQNEQGQSLLPEICGYGSQGFVPSLFGPQPYTSTSIPTQGSLYVPPSSTQPFTPVFNNMDVGDKDTAFFNTQGNMSF